MAIIDIVNSAINSLIGQGGSREYYRTPKPSNQSDFISGKPDFLNPETWNAHNIFLTTPQLYTVISKRGYLLSTGIWKHYKINSDGTKTEIINSPYVNLLENPNPLMNGNDLIRQWNENKCIYGNNYEYVLRAFPMDIPATLTNICPTTVSIKTSGRYYKQTELSEIITSYQVQVSNMEFDTLSPSEVNHTKVVNSINPIKGESPMIPIYMPISNIRAAYQFRNVIMTKKGALGILSNGSKDSSGAIPLKDTEKKNLIKEYMRSFGIGDNQESLIITNASLTWQPTTFPTKDLMLFEEIDSNTLAIIDNYGMNANIFSNTKGSTFENQNQGLKQVYQSTIIPEAEELAMNRSRLFGLIEKGEYVELCYDHIAVLQENEKEESEVELNEANTLKILSETGLYSADELKSMFED